MFKLPTKRVPASGTERLATYAVIVHTYGKLVDMRHPHQGILDSTTIRGPILWRNVRGEVAGN